MSLPIHVCIITTAHPVDDVRVNSKISHAFAGAGFRVSWVGPGHAFFDHKQYNRDGIEFVLAPPIRNRVGRIMSGSHVRRLATSVEKVDVYYAPDPDSAPLAIRLAKQNGAKVIFDIHEIYHGALLDRWLFGRQLKPVREYLRRRIGVNCQECDLVIGVSDAVLDQYIQDQSKRMVVRSCAPSWFAEGLDFRSLGLDRPRLTLMHGKADLLRGTSMLLDAVGLVVKDEPDMRVVMITRSEPEIDPVAKILRSMASDRSILSSLDLRKGVPMQEMPEILRSCDVGLISYGRGLGIDSLPNRLFEYMAVGLAVVAPIYSIEIAKIIEAEKCGLLADFEDPASIAAAIAGLYRDPEACREMGRRGREAFLARHNWEVEVRPLLDKIQSWFPDKGSI